MERAVNRDTRGPEVAGELYPVTFPVSVLGTSIPLYKGCVILIPVYHVLLFPCIGVPLHYAVQTVIPGKRI